MFDADSAGDMYDSRISCKYAPLSEQDKWIKTNSYNDHLGLTQQCGVYVPPWSSNNAANFVYTTAICCKAPEKPKVQATNPKPTWTVLPEPGPGDQKDKYMPTWQQAALHCKEK